MHFWLSLLLYFLTHSAIGSIHPTPVGIVKNLKGKAFKLVPTVGVKRKKVMLSEGMGVFESDIIATERLSYVELEMVDETYLQLAPSSSFEIKKFRFVPGIQRETHYHQSWGALRARVKKISTQNEAIQFNTKLVALGVEESEFLSNSYSVKNNPTHDLLLIRGKVNVNVDQLNLKTKNFELREGMLFNSNMLVEKGAASFPRIKESLINFILATKDLFLPRAQASSGEYVNVNQILSNKVIEKNLIQEEVWPTVRAKQKWSQLFQVKD